VAIAALILVTLAATLVAVDVTGAARAGTKGKAKRWPPMIEPRTLIALLVALVTICSVILAVRYATREQRAQRAPINVALSAASNACGQKPRQN
jgi:hypothetical protein